MYNRILMVRLSHLGDVIHALPVYHALRAAYPEAQLAWAIQAEFADVLKGLPGLSRVFLFGRREGFSAWSRLRSEFAAWQPDWSIDAQGNTKSAMVALTSAAARRSGLARADWRERFASHSTTDRASSAAGPHAVDRMIALARHVAPQIPVTAHRFDLSITEAERSRGRELLDGHGPVTPDRGVPDWIVHLSNPADVRAWPVAHFEHVIRELQACGKSVLVLSGPTESEAGQALAARVDLPGVAHWIGQRGLRDLASTFAAAALGGSRMLACDSGPAHLGAATGLAVDLLAGPQDPGRTGPWQSPGGPPHTVHRHPNPPECAPCLSRRCSHPDGPVCMAGLLPAPIARTLPQAAVSVTPPSAACANPT